MIKPNLKERNEEFMPYRFDIWIADVMEEILLLKLLGPHFVVKERIGGEKPKDGKWFY